jgi:hypothetical protein
LTLPQSRSELRLGKPSDMSRFIYLYMLQSEQYPDRFYIGAEHGTFVLD